MNGNHRAIGASTDVGSKRSRNNNPQSQSARE